MSPKRQPGKSFIPCRIADLPGEPPARRVTSRPIIVPSCWLRTDLLAYEKLRSCFWLEVLALYVCIWCPSGGCRFLLRDASGIRLHVRWLRANRMHGASLVQGHALGYLSCCRLPGAFGVACVGARIFEPLRMYVCASRARATVAVRVLSCNIYSRNLLALGGHVRAFEFAELPQAEPLRYCNFLACGFRIF